MCRIYKNRYESTGAYVRWTLMDRDVNRPDTVSAATATRGTSRCRSARTATRASSSSRPRSTDSSCTTAPIKELRPGEPEDFIILELRSGYPYLRINHGSGETKLTVDGRDRQGQIRLGKLNDGHWHRVDIIRNGKASFISLSWVTLILVQRDFISVMFFRHHKLYSFCRWLW